MFFSHFGSISLGIVFGIIAYITSLTFSVSIYNFSCSESHITLWFYLTLASLFVLIVLFSPFIILFYIYKFITTKLHLNSLSRNLELFLLRAALFFITLLIIFSTAVMLPNNLAAQLVLVIVFVVYNLLKRWLVYIAVPGKKKIYYRYKIKREFQYIDDFILSLCLLVKQFIFEQGFDNFLSFFLIISAIYATLKAAEYFKSNTRHTNCLQIILSDLENCIDCLALVDPKTELRVRINIDTTFLRVCYKNGNKKVKKAIESIYSLVFSGTAEGNEEQGKNSNIHCPFTYNCTAAQMKTNIETTLNAIVRAL